MPKMPKIERGREGKREGAKERRSEGVKGRGGDEVRGRRGEGVKEGKKNQNSEKLNTKKLENRKPRSSSGQAKKLVLANIRT